MLAVVSKCKLITHVVRSPDVYIVPRSDGRILIGATVEEAGYDKRVVPDTIRAMHQAAIKVVPALAEARMIEDWAGLRPGTPDGLPILGRTPTPGYYIATGHFRDGILLTPITALLVSQIITGETPSLGVDAFSAQRFI
jgi:glycine oxidase